jgi:hypothetical protein
MILAELQRICTNSKRRDFQDPRISFANSNVFADGGGACGAAGLVAGSQKDRIAYFDFLAGHMCDAGGSFSQQ